MNPRFPGGRFALRAAVLLASAAASPVLADPVLADDAALRAEIETLRSSIEAQRAQLAAQAALLEQQQKQLEALTQRLDQPEPAPQEGAKVTLANARPTITAADGGMSIALRANVQLDGAMYGESPAGPLATDFRRGSVGGAPNRENAGARDFSDGFYFRRARFGVEGKFAQNFNYRLLLELGGGGGTEGPTRINDAWIAYTGFAPFAIQIGAFSPPSNMDDGTSPEDIAFLERASAAELSRSLGGADGRIGVGVRGSGARWMSAFTLTNRTVSDAEVFDSQLAAVARAGFLVATGSDYNVHAGLSGTYVISPPDQGADATLRHPMRFRDRPEIRVDSTRLIDTGSIDAAHASVLGVEFGANWKNLYLQGEHFWFDVERRDPTTLGDPSFTGYYVQGSWVLTGEHRRYNPATGSFQNPRPMAPFAANGGSGAWELAARYSRMDLDHDEGLEGSAAVPGSVRGGEQSILTLGVNWYVNANFKVMMNYLLIDVDRLNPAGPGNPQPFGAPPNTPPIGVEIGQDLDVFALRTQYSF
jgi:phosphate-selective porin OprO/OprP